MIRTLLVSAVTTLALVAPAAAADASTDAAPREAQLAAGIAGTWTGGFDVTGSNAQDSGVVLKIKKKGNKYTGTVTHKGFCAGTLKFKGRSGGYFKFTEKLTKSLKPGLVCTPTVDLKVKRKGGKLKGVWSNNGQTANGTMRRG
ncbi:hypothetical protein [Nocardioides sp. LHG3406-4]|uniref:hypothetical protein n=1 Tax=Nocardioides sp. LHG3406-4 TaxID=2804575 RepID=UPI003CF95D79